MKFGLPYPVSHDLFKMLRFQKMHEFIPTSVFMKTNVWKIELSFEQFLELEMFGVPDGKQNLIYDIHIEEKTITETVRSWFAESKEQFEYTIYFESKEDKQKYIDQFKTWFGLVSFGSIEGYDGNLHELEHDVQKLFLERKQEYHIPIQMVSNSFSNFAYQSGLSKEELEERKQNRTQVKLNWNKNGEYFIFVHSGGTLGLNNYADLVQNRTDSYALEIAAMMKAFRLKLMFQ